MTPTFRTHLQTDAPTLFVACRIDLRSGPVIRLVSGSIEIAFDGGVYTGRDATFGVLDSIEPIEDGISDQAPGFVVGLIVPTASALADIAAPSMQGSRVRVWFGGLVRATGAVVADPELLADGLIDRMSLTASRERRSLAISCASAIDRFFVSNEGNTLPSRFHNTLWPSEQGFDNATGVPTAVAWGVDAPARGIAIGVGGGGGQGGRFDYATRDL